MKTINLLKELKNYPLFTDNDISKILNKKSNYIKTFLSRLYKRKLIYRIERGKYTVHEDPLLFASYINNPSYISLWTAFRYYNLTEQLPKTIFIMVPKSRKSIKIGNIEIKFVKTKYFFGFKKERYEDFDIFIAESEKAIIDSLISKIIPLDEIIKAIKSKSTNVKKLIKYLLKTKNKNLIKRIGFILNENKFSYKRLDKYLDNNYTLLDTMLKKKGEKIKKWRIIDNR